MNIVLVGSGNVAHHLAIAFEKIGFTISLIYSRSLQKAEALASKLYDAPCTTSLDFRAFNNHLFVLAVSDKAIEEVCQNMVLPPKGILVHTSGTVPFSVLDKLKQNYENEDLGLGIFYPLMTFSKSVAVDMRQVPFCLEASDKKVLQILTDIVKQIGGIPHYLNSKQRKALHVGAVFTNNFINHILALAKEIVDEKEIDFGILKPLALETVRKAFLAEHPALVQTGPAIRNDLSTIHSHIDYLKDDEDLQKLYKLLTDSIQDWHGE
ncbi:MAG: Rossmann-like and DUF2520 domain-containing protein [Leadbetterella sp.]